MNKELAKAIGSAAREARKTLQLTQEDAAERINVSVEFYARIERGNSLPSIGTFARIVSALGVSADTLLGGKVVDHKPAQGPADWTPPAIEDGPELRRLVRRLRKARASTLRVVSMLIKEIDSMPAMDSQDPHEEHLPLSKAAIGDSKEAISMRHRHATPLRESTAAQ